MKFRGVIVPAATPLNSEGSLDRSGFQRLLAFLIDSRVDALFVNGSMGAFALLPDRVQYAAIESAVAVVNGRIPLLAGASDTGAARVLDKIRAFSGVAVDAFVVMPPYYYLLEQRELLRFYQRIADASPKPVLLYDNPRLTKNAIGVQIAAQLAAHPNIVGIKISHTDVQGWQGLLAGSIDRDRFALISGAGRMNSLALRLGFDGITEGLHNIVPNMAVDLFQAACLGDFDRADRLQQQINRCFRVFEVDGGWRGLEVALQHMGIASRAAPEPYDLPMPEEKRQEILNVLEREQVLRPYAPLALTGRE